MEKEEIRRLITQFTKISLFLLYFIIASDDARLRSLVCDLENFISVLKVVNQVEPCQQKQFVRRLVRS